MGQSDEELGWVRRSQAGDHEAFAALVTRYQHMVHSLTIRMTGSLADGEDLAQETFLRAFQQLASFRGDARFASWLHRIAVNACLNWHKRQARRHQLHDAWCRETLADNGKTDADESGAHDGNFRHVNAALQQLSARQRAAVVLTVYEGLSHAEAARALGCSEATVSWRLFAARRKLKRLLRSTNIRD